jgi:phosphotransferase system HPr (HPr) family protein
VTVRRRVTLRNRIGLHARPASLLAETARRFASQIALVGVEGTELAGKRADAKSVLDLLFFGPSPGTDLDVVAEGPDAEVAVRSIEELFARRLGDSE